jgi:integrase
VLRAYRHGFRVSELVALRWDQVDLKAGCYTLARLKNGIASNPENWKPRGDTAADELRVPAPFRMRLRREPID